MNKNALFFGSIFKGGFTNKCCDNDFLNIAIEDSDSINFDGNGTVQNPLTGDVIISEEPDNTLELLEDGLYVPPSGSSAITVEDTTTVTLTGDGTIGTPLLASVIISPEVGNQLIDDGQGLYMPLLNEFPTIFIGEMDALSGNSSILMQAPFIYNNVWQATFSGGAFLLNAADILAGGWVSGFGSGATDLTFPSADDIATQLGTSDITGWIIDFRVFNGGAGDLTITLGAGMTAFSALTGGNNLVVSTITAATYRLMGVSDGATNNFQVSRLN